MAPYKQMILKADINRIYDEKLRERQRSQSNNRKKKEKLFRRPERQRKMKNTKWFASGMGIDLPFCIILLILLTIGTIMMFSASYAFSYYTNEGDSYYFLWRQLIFIAIGIVAMIVMSFFNYNKLHKIAPLVLGIAYVCLLIVLVIPAGQGGVKRWIPLGMFNIQPSEIAKFAIILFFAHWASKCGYTGDNLGIWQYGGETNVIESNSIDGVGVIDKNRCYRDYPTVIKAGGFNAYVRQEKRKLTLMRIEKSDMQQFEKEQEQCAVIIREAVSDYREQQKPIDDKLNALVQENRQKMRRNTSYLLIN